MNNSISLRIIDGKMLVTVYVGGASREQHIFDDRSAFAKYIEENWTSDHGGFVDRYPEHYTVSKEVDADAQR